MIQRLGNPLGKGVRFGRGDPRRALQHSAMLGHVLQFGRVLQRIAERFSTAFSGGRRILGEDPLPARPHKGLPLPWLAGMPLNFAAGTTHTEFSSHVMAPFEPVDGSIADGFVFVLHVETPFRVVKAWALRFEAAFDRGIVIEVAIDTARQDARDLRSHFLPSQISISNFQSVCVQQQQEWIHAVTPAHMISISNFCRASRTLLEASFTMRAKLGTGAAAGASACHTRASRSAAAVEIP